MSTTGIHPNVGPLPASQKGEEQVSCAQLSKAAAQPTLMLLEI